MNETKTMTKAELRATRAMLRETTCLLRAQQAGVYEDCERGISALVLDALFDGADLTVGAWEVE